MFLTRPFLKLHHFYLLFLFLGEHDLGNDESVERCCTAENTLNNYRCALGHHPGNVSISDECIPRNCVCDWDVNRDDCPSCLNGADEVDCMSIYGHKKHGYYGEYLLRVFF